MKFLRLGVIAAMAMALCGQQALAADAPPKPKMDPKSHEQAKADAPALVQAGGLKCDVTDAYLLGSADEKVNGKTFKSSFYEIACGQELSWAAGERRALPRRTNGPDAAIRQIGEGTNVGGRGSSGTQARCVAQTARMSSTLDSRNRQALPFPPHTKGRESCSCESTSC